MGIRQWNTSLDLLRLPRLEHMDVSDLPLGELPATRGPRFRLLSGANDSDYPGGDLGLTINALSVDNGEERPPVIVRWQSALVFPAILNPDRAPWEYLPEELC